MNNSEHCRSHTQKVDVGAKPTKKRSVDPFNILKNSVTNIAHGLFGLVKKNSRWVSRIKHSRSNETVSTGDDFSKVLENLLRKMG